MNADDNVMKGPKRIGHYLTCGLETIRQGLKNQKKLASKGGLPNC